MTIAPSARLALRLFTWLGLGFLYVPLVAVAALSLNTATSLAWPPKGLSLQWWERAADATGPRDALATSFKVALAATIIALLLGSLAAFALTRYAFFGRSTISLLLVLPIALPGIVTAVALQSSFLRLGVGLGLGTVVVAHATFCVVITYNNVIARLRRTGTSFAEASADLGADPWQTFRHVTFPLVRSAVAAGGLLAFALSFDEIIVTTFTSGPGVETLPQWILNNFSRPNNIPLVNVVATVVMLLSIPLAWLAQRLSDGAAALGGGR